MIPTRETREQLLHRLRVASGVARTAVAERDTARRDLTAATEGRDTAYDQLAEVLEVMARWGADIDEGSPAAVLETLLRDAVWHGAVTARSGRALGVAS